MGLFDKKSVVIIGATSERGIGYACVNAFREQGAFVTVFHRPESEQAAVKMKEGLLCHHIIPCDVTNKESVISAFNEYGILGRPIDTLVFTASGNAAIQADSAMAVARASRALFQKPFHEIEPEEMAGMNSVIATPLLRLAQCALPYLEQSANPSIIVFSYLGATDYVAQYHVGPPKALLESTAYYLGGSLGERGIRVNVIRAGAIRTVSAGVFPGLKAGIAHQEAVSPLEGTLTSADVADATVSLASPLMRAVTCQIINVDNGFHAVGVQLAN